MNDQKKVSVEEICQYAIQGKLNLYQEKERFDSMLKRYNDNLDTLINVLGVLKTQLDEKNREISELKRNAVNQIKQEK